MHSHYEKDEAHTEKACEKFISVGMENSVMSMQEDKMCFENCDETEYDISKKIKKESRNYSLHQVYTHTKGKYMVKLVTNRKFNVTDSSKTKKRCIIPTNFNILFISFLF